MKTCPSRERLQELLSGNLSEIEEQALDTHVGSCAACLKTLEELTVVDDAPTRVLRERRQAGAAEMQPPHEALISRLLVGSSNGASPVRPSSPSPPIPGFEILGKLGHGGMGVVYKAKQLDLLRTVAIKMVLGGVHGDRQDLDRLRAEAEAVAQLQHPNIVQIYAVGEADGLPYYSLEYVEGGTLAQQVAGTTMEPHRAAQFVAVLARAVHFAHTHGVIHRDLKPANVLLTSDGAPKIADFGLAKRFGADGGMPSTEVGLAVGTPRYMAPEQLSPLAEGKNRKVGLAVDIYALGAILYELLTGRPMFAGDSALDVVVRVLHEDPTPPRVFCPGLPRDLETICLKCLAKDPARRYASAQALADDLDRYLRGQPIQARPPSILYRSGKFIQRNQVLVGASLAVGAALLVGIVATGLAALREGQQRSLAELNARKADSARELALLEAYQARLAAALSALGEHNIGAAANQLASVPAERRGWEWYYANSRLDDSVFAWHGNGLSPIPYAGGSRIAAMVPEGIQICDAYSGEVLAKIPDKGVEHFEPLTTPYGTVIIHGRKGQFSLSSETESGRKKITVPANGINHAVAVDRAGTRLARASIDDGAGSDQLALYDLATGKLLWRRDQPEGQLCCLAFHPDGRLLAGGDDLHSVYIWDADSGVCLRTLKGHRGLVHSVTFNPDGRRLLSASADGTFRQWDVATGQLLDERFGHNEHVHIALYTPDGAWIISGGGDGTVRYWDVAGGPALTVLHGHSGPVVRLAVSADGKRVASASGDGSVRFFEGPGRGDARVLRGHLSFVYAVAFSPDGRLLASGGWDNTVRLWDTATGLPVGVLTGHKGYVAALAFSPDSRRLVSRSADNTLRIWDVAERKTIAVLKHGFMGHADMPHRVAVTPDGTRVACAGDNRLYFWDLETGKEAGTLPLPGADVRVAAFRPDGKQIATVGAGSVINLINAQTGAEETTLQGHGGQVHDVSFSADGTRLVSASADQDLRIWDTDTGECLHILHGHTGAVFTAAILPGGTRIASGGRDRAVRIWDTATGAELAALHGHSDYVFALQFSPDGASLASGSGDYTVRLWDTFPIARRLQQRAQAPGIQEYTSRSAR